MENLNQRLSLVVVNSEQLVGGNTRAQHLFDELGGTLGSSAQDDWPLQDRLGSVLAAHARIEYHDGRFCLSDLSGQTYLQGVSTPIGRERKVCLQQGDELNLGAVRLRVYLQLREVAPHESLLQGDPGGRGMAPWLSDEVTASCITTETKHLPTSLLASGTATPLVDPAVRGSPVLSAALTAGEKRAEQACIDMPIIEQRARPMAGLAVHGSVLTPLLRGLGQEGRWSGETLAQERIEEIGQTLRAAVEGLLALQVEQNTLADKELKPLEDNPLRLGLNCDDTLAVLFSEKKSPVHLTAPAAVAESLHHMRIHHLANQQAIGVALASLLQAFSPETLLARFSRYRRESPPSLVTDDGWAWGMYQHYYQELTSIRQQGLERLFHQVYAQAYDQAVRQQQGGM